MDVALAMQDNMDFRRARSKSLIRRVWGALSGRRTNLLPWDQVRDKLKLRGLIRRGTQTVPIAKIKGSVGRYRDFDNAFLPTNDSVGYRWRKINRAFYKETSLPPVSLYKVGDAYFVLDGNHRISVACEHGIKFIDAEVQEAVTPVPVTADDMNSRSLTLLGEYAEFLERTRLHVLRPDQNIRFSASGGYARLTDHIAVHRYFMGLERRREVSEDEAVADWYDTLYLPTIRAILKTRILLSFHGCTEADLYLWIIDHRHFLKERHGCDVSPEEAAVDYAKRYAQKHPLDSLREALSQLSSASGAFFGRGPRLIRARAAAH